MLKANLFKTLSMVGLVAVLVSACLPTAAQPNSETQAVAAAQATLTAMPTKSPFPPSTDTPAPTPTLTPTSTPEPTATPSAYGPSGFPENVNPLTGLTVADPKILDRGPVMIKIANYPAVGRPHAGLSAADLVFEYYIGEGTNRFLALFYGQDAPKAGPIRSARFVDAQLVPMYDGILGFAYADPKVFSKVTGTLGNRYFLPGGVNCPAICDDGRNTVISVFADTAKFTELANSQGLNEGRPNLDGMRFDSQAPQGGQPGSNATILYSWYNRGEWRYDPTSGSYLRWIEELDASNNVSMVELTDANTEKQIGFNNVIVLFSMYIEYAPTLHDISMVTNLGGQRAVIFRDGQAYEAIWKSAGADKPLQFFTSDGQPFALKPGNSWLAIMGTGTQAKQPEPGKWEFQFFLP